MSSIPNVLSSYGDKTMNRHGSIPIQMNSSFRNHESKMVRSMFNTSNVMNHHDLFSSSHAFDCYQDSHVSSSSLGFDNPHMAYQMRNNMVSNVVDYSSINDNPHFSQVSIITQTITKSYSAIVPTSNLITFQNGYERAFSPSILNPAFYPPTFVDNQREILNPQPLNTVYPRNLNQFSFPPKNHYDKHVLPRRPAKKRPNPTRNFEESFDGFDLEEDGEYDGRTHSLPYEKYGPYTCPKCENVFDSSQKFAAHVSSTHYKNETVEERAKRYNARNKKRFRKMHGETHMMQPEDRVVEDSACNNNNIQSGIEPFQHHRFLMQEPCYDVID